MRVFLLGILFLSIAVNGKRDKIPVNTGDSGHSLAASKGNDVDIGKKIGDLLTFLCTRCQEIITQISDSIENESLVNYANDFCNRSIGNEVLREFCSDAVKDVLVQLYKQLRKFEPHPSLCTHLRLCDACAPSPTGSTYRSLPVLLSTSNPSEFINPFHFYSRMTPLVELFTADAAIQKNRN